ncbi:TetR/AcrR family transcriptional regulator [Silvibacterium acidisoli]|uniref:TetR/AcrR family transcriptional regulator n=1 Tax=Acidobacteriaceae bacterium ZG23-2 TaxID=2883246 RepID=UPI00406C02ED
MQNDTADRILAAAHSLMAELGYAGFSYADIAERVSIRKPSIHHHFPTKAELAVAVLRKHREGLIGGTQAIDKNIQDPLKRLGAYVKYWEGCLADGTQPFCVAALLAAELPGLPAEVAAELKLHFASLKQWIRKTLEAGVKNGKIRVQDSFSVEADAFMAVVHGALLASRVSGTCDAFREITSSALKKLAAARR